MDEFSTAPTNAGSLTRIIAAAGIADGVAGDEQLAIVQDVITVAGGGSPEGDGRLTCRGMVNGYPYFSFETWASNTDRGIHVGLDVKWHLTDSLGNPLYKSNQTADNYTTVAEAMADVDVQGGVGPVPTVTVTPTLLQVTPDVLFRGLTVEDGRISITSERMVTLGGVSNSISISDEEDATSVIGQVITPGGTRMNSNGQMSVEPESLADGAAINNTIYYSTTASKLVFKDSGGVVRALY